jgi:FG-GAP-like repeat
MTHRPLAWTIGFLFLLSCGSETGGPVGPATGSSTGPSGSGGSGSGTAGSGTGGDGTTTTATGGATTGPGGSGVGGSGSGGSSVLDGSVGDAIAPAACSDKGPDPTPKAPFVKANPIDMRFPFSTHWMGMFNDDPTKARCISMTSLTDIDNDGDQDFSSGQRDVACSGSSNPGAPVIWWEYCSADHWVRHVAGTGYHSAAAGGAADFDNDGWIDLVAGDSWFKNPGAGVKTAGAWTRYGNGAPGQTEEITIGDLNADNKLDALYLVRDIDPQWWTPGADPTKTWTRTVLSAYRQQQGGAIGDLDGDGRNDALAGDRWWYKSPAPGGMWTPMPIPASSDFASSGTTGSAPLTTMGDIDGDGDLDIVMSSHWGYNVAWIENRDGKGTMFAVHMIAGPNAPFPARTAVLHNVLAYDFDNDGDIDVQVGENVGAQWIFENTNGKGTWAEHKYAVGPGHEARAADVDCDGDLDIVGKSWSDPNDGAAGRTEIAALLGHHVYYRNELVERGGTPVFMRPKGEVWNVPNKGLCRK